MNWILKIAQKNPSFRRSLISKLSASNRRPGEVWETAKGFGAMAPNGKTLYFTEKSRAESFAKRKGPQQEKLPVSIMDLWNSSPKIPPEVEKKVSQIVEDRLKSDPESIADKIIGSFKDTSDLFASAKVLSKNLNRSNSVHNKILNKIIKSIHS